MKILFDINVVLDVILKREPWSRDSSALLDAAERRKVTGYVAAHTITTVYYIVAKVSGARRAATAVADLLRIVKIAPIAEADFTQALVLGIADFEDSVQAAAAAKVGADYIATRNGKDFRNSPVKPRSPAELLAMLSA